VPDAAAAAAAPGPSVGQGMDAAVPSAGVFTNSIKTTLRKLLGCAAGFV